MAKYNLPSLYGSEYSKYIELVKTGNQRTTTGDVSFTSSTSAVPYNTSSSFGGIYSDQGQEGLFNMLWKQVLSPYSLDEETVYELLRERDITNTNLSYLDGVLDTISSYVDTTLYKVETLVYLSGILSSVGTVVYEIDGVNIFREYEKNLIFDNGVLSEVIKEVI